MRRKDREMPESFALQVIDKADFGVLSLCHQGKAFSRILSFARDGNHIYFHSATSGEKVERMEEGIPVSLAFAADVAVPELYHEGELKELLEKEGMGLLLTKVFTTQYASAMVEGSLHRAEGEEKTLGLRRICEKYTATKMEYFEEALELSLDHVLVYRVDIEKITGKRKKFDAQGEEMKWQRQD